MNDVDDWASNPWDTGQGWSPNYGTEATDVLALGPSAVATPSTDAVVADIKNAAVAAIEALRNAVDESIAAARRVLRDRYTSGPPMVETWPVKLAIDIETAVVVARLGARVVEELEAQAGAADASEALSLARKLLASLEGDIDGKLALIANSSAVDLVLALTTLKRHHLVMGGADADYLRVLLDRGLGGSDQRVKLCAWAVQHAEWKSGDPVPDGDPLTDPAAGSLGTRDGEPNPLAVIDAAMARSTSWDVRWNAQATMPDFRLATALLITGERNFREVRPGYRWTLGLPTFKITQTKPSGRPVYQYSGSTKAYPAALASAEIDDTHDDNFWKFARAWWEEARAEGGVSAVVTDAGLTWGLGFLGAMLDSVVKGWLRRAPDVGRHMRLLGFVQSETFGGHWTYVRLAGGDNRKLAGVLEVDIPAPPGGKGKADNQASDAVVWDLHTLYGLLELGEMQEHDIHQAFCDAQWDVLAKAEILQQTAAAKFARSTWSVEEGMFVAHAQHWVSGGKASFEQGYVGPDNARRTTMQRIYKTGSDAAKIGSLAQSLNNQGFRLTNTTSVTLLSLGGRFVERFLEVSATRIDKVPEQPPFAAIYVGIADPGKDPHAFYQLLP